MWQKLGLVYSAQGETPWQHSHAYIPTPILLDDATIRVFVAFLDRENIGRIGYVDVEARDPQKIIGVSQVPSLDIGVAGSFDDNGVTPICILPVDGKLRLYYTGWQLSSRVRYFLFTGAAVSSDNGRTFARLSQVPVLERSDAELTVRTAACVLRDDRRWKMWYIAGSRTIEVNGKQVPTYDMRYMESDDGLRWPASGEVILSPVPPDEYGFGRPYVTVDEAGFKMWYSIRSVSSGYRLGYAESRDGRAWQRLDSEVGIAPTLGSWDSDMQAFAAPLSTKYGRYLFYNGNDFGRTGFGVAAWTCGE